MSWRWRKGVLASPTLSATLLADQPRPGAPAWAAGWVQLHAVPTAGPGRPLPRGQECKVPRSRGAQSAPLHSAWWETRSSLAPDAGAGRAAVPSRCGVPCSLLPPPAREAHVWVWSRPPPLRFAGWRSVPAPLRVQPGAGVKREGFPSASSGFLTQRRPRARSGAAAAAARTTSRQRNLCHWLRLEEAVAARLARGLEAWTLYHWTAREVPPGGSC